MKQHRTDYDLMRIIACFLVIFNHLDGYTLYQRTAAGWKTWACMVPTMITRINVPMFFMISGALLLNDRDESYKEIICKRISRILILIVVSTTVIYGLYCRKTQSAPGMGAYLRNLIGGPYDIGGVAYWYLYSYVGFLLLLPILRRVTKGMTRQDFGMLLIAHFVIATVVPVANLIPVAHGIERIKLDSDLTGALNIAVNKPIFYPLIGYYVDRKIDLAKISLRHIVSLILASAAGIIFSCFCTFYEGMHNDMNFTQHYVQIFDYLITITVFVAVKFFFAQIEHKSWFPKISGVLVSVGGLTLGMYLLDPVWRNLFYHSFREIAVIKDSVMFNSLLWCVVSMIAGALVTWLLKKNPAVAKVL